MNDKEDVQNYIDYLKTIEEREADNVVKMINLVWDEAELSNEQKVADER
jgi:aromatic ring hydroxylase